jgi:hypothetical protein
MADKNQPLKINNRKRAVDGESWLEKGFSTGSLDGKERSGVSKIPKYGHA